MNMSSKIFNANFRAFIHCDGFRMPLGYNNLIAFLGDKSEIVFSRLIRNKSDKVVIKPFHGIVIYFYVR